MRTNLKNYFISIITNDKKIFCIGYQDEYLNAENIVRANIGGIWQIPNVEYIVLEGVKQGLFMYEENPIFFKWNEKKCCGEMLKDIPNDFKDKQAIGFGIKLK